VRRAHPVAEPVDHRQHRADQLAREQVRLEPEIEQLRVRRVVVVRLCLDARVVERADLDVQAGLDAGLLDELREL
jgi:hypothetical protein